MKKAFGIIVSSVLSCLLSATLIHAQQKNSPQTEFVPAPISVVRLDNKTDSKSSAQRVDVAGNFLQVENTSAKTIRYLRIDFYDAVQLQPPVAMVYGQIGSGLHTNKWDLKPGERVFLSIRKNSELQRGQTPEQIARRLAATRGKSEIAVVVFTDGTAWADGMLHQQDPHDSLRWNVIEQSAPRNLLAESALLQPVSFTPISFKAPTRQEPCYRYQGFTVVNCCGINQMSHILTPDPFATWEPLQMSVECPEGGTCQWIKRQFCGQGDGD